MLFIAFCMNLMFSLNKGAIVEENQLKTAREADAAIGTNHVTRS